MKDKLKKIIGYFTYKALLCLNEVQSSYVFRQYENNHLKQYKNNRYKMYDIHPSVGIGDRTLIYGSGEITIGEGTYMGQYCYIQSESPAKISIGKYCALSHNIHIRTSDYKKSVFFKDSLILSNEVNDISIGNYVWIGANVFICSGVSIGDNAIIGANSVVTKDVASNSVVGGVPAKFIFNKFERYQNG